VRRASCCYPARHCHRSSRPYPSRSTIRRRCSAHRCCCTPQGPCGVGHDDAVELIVLKQVVFQRPGRPRRRLWRQAALRCAGLRSAPRRSRTGRWLDERRKWCHCRGQSQCRFQKGRGVFWRWHQRARLSVTVSCTRTKQVCLCHPAATPRPSKATTMSPNGKSHVQARRLHRKRAYRSGIGTSLILIRPRCRGGEFDRLGRSRGGAGCQGF
jgi:hypothetical protein